MNPTSNTSSPRLTVCVKHICLFRPAAFIITDAQNKSVCRDVIMFVSVCGPHQLLDRHSSTKRSIIMNNLLFCSSELSDTSESYCQCEAPEAMRSDVLFTTGSTCVPQNTAACCDRQRRSESLNPNSGARRRVLAPRLRSQLSD